MIISLHLNLPTRLALLLVISSCFCLLKVKAQTEGDDLPTLSIADVTVTEGDSGTVNAEFTVTLDPASEDTVTVDYATADGTATAGTDYTSANGALTFAAGDTEKTIIVAVLGDMLDEEDEIFTVRLNNPANATIETGEGTGTITDDDNAPTEIILTVSPASASEGATTEVTVTAAFPDGSSSLTTATEVSVTVGGAGSTATGGGTDFDDVTGFTLTIPAGDTSVTGQPFDLTVAEDDLVEGDETVQVSGTATNFDVTPADITLTDTDMATVNLSEDMTVDEGDTAEFTVSLSLAVSSPVTLSWQTTAGSATAGDDYTSQAATEITFDAGDIDDKTLTVDIADDNLVEGEETFTVTLSLVGTPPTGVSLGTSEATVTIRDEDSPAVSLTESAVRVNEGDAHTFTVEMSRLASAAVILQVSTEDDAARAPGDYEALVDHEVTLPPGELSQTFTVQTTSDDVVEGDETFTVKVEAAGALPAGVTLAATEATVTITDDDTATVGFSPPPPPTTVTEDGGAQAITVMLSKEASETVKVQVSTEDGTAVAPGDYGALSNHVLTFTPGDTEKLFTVTPVSDEVVDGPKTFTVTLQEVGTLPTGVTLGTTEVTVTIGDGDTASVGFLSIATTVTEDGEAQAITVMLSKEASEPVELQVSTEDGTAVAPGDYEALVNHPVTIAAGQTQTTFMVEPASDDVTEGTESFTILLSRATTLPPGVWLGRTELRVDIDDGDRVHVGYTNATVRVDEDEDAPAIEVKLRPTGSTLPEDVKMLVSTKDGTATAGEDYEAFTDQAVTIAAGETRTTFTVTPLSDDLAEGDEQFTVRLTLDGPPQAGVSLANRTLTVIIRDEDSATVDLSVASAWLPENQTWRGDVRLSRTVSSVVNLLISTMDGTATAGEDYEALVDHSVTLQPGEISKRFEFVLKDDEVVEEIETFTLKLSPDGELPADVVLGKTTHTVEIQSDDEATVDLPSSPLTVDEDGDAQEITVTLSDESVAEFDVSFSVTTADGTATAPDDYGALVDHRVTIPAGETSTTFDVTPAPDDVVEGDETFTVALRTVQDGFGRVSGLSLGNAEATVTIRDEDSPTANLTVTDARVAEGASHTFTVELSKTAPSTVTLEVSTSDGTATAGDDYEALSGHQLVFAPGETSKAFTVETLSDGETEENEDFTVTLREVGTLPVGVSLGTTEATVTIVDGDSVVVNLPATATVIEGGGAQEITVTLSEAVSSRVNLKVTTEDDTAAAPGDYAELSDEVVTIQAGETSTTFTVTPVDDEIVEGLEAFTVRLSEMGLPSGVVLETPVTTVTIQDNDSATISLSPPTPKVAEGDTAEFTVELSNAVSFSPVTLSWQTVAGTATTGDDYTAQAATGITFDAGDNASKTLKVPISTDFLVEGDETFTVELSASGSLPNGVVFFNSTAILSSIVTIEGAGSARVSISPATQNVAEDAGTASLTVSLDTASPDTAVGNDVTLSWRTDDDTAVSPGDYTAQAATEITFDAGDAADKTLTVPIIDDSLVEEDESFTVTLSSSSLPTGVSLRNTTSTVTLTDNDTAPTGIILTVDPTSAAEGTTTAVTVTAAFPDGSPALTTATEVSVTVGAGTATGGGTDFDDVAGFTLTIPAEDTSVTSESFDLKTTEDELFEGPETVQVSGTADGFTVTPAEIAITDDDAPVISIAAQSVNEDAGSATLTVTRTGDLSGTSSADYAFSDGTATGSGTDYTGTSGTVTFAANEGSQTLPVSIVQDTLWEDPDETFTVTLSSPSGATLDPNGTSATITITDDDDAPTAVSLRLVPTAVTEGGGAQTVTVHADVQGGTTYADATEVTVTVSAGTATLTTDYAVTTAAGTITIPAGGTTASTTFGITPVSDTLVETGGETLTVGGSSGSLTVNAATLTITDDDTAPSTVTLSVDNATVVESAGTSAATVTATLDNAAQPGGVTVTLTAGGTATGGGVDYTLSSASIAIAEGATEGAATLDIVQDTIDDDGEAIELSATVTGSLTVEGSPVTVTITDDDDAPTAVSLRLVPTAVTEGGGAQTVTVHADVQGGTTYADATEVTVSVSAGTATATTDYAITTAQGTITIAAGGATASTTFGITPVSDTLVETGNETVTVEGSSGSLTVNAATLTITDDDTAPDTITLTVDPTSAAEGATTDVTVTAALPRRQPLADHATEVSVTVSAGTATQGTDFTAVSGTLAVTIDAGQTSGSATDLFSLEVLDDTVVDPGETVTVSGTATNFTVNSATLTLTDTDTAPTEITLTVDTDAQMSGEQSEVGEGVSARTITVKAAFPDGSPVLTTATEVTVTVGGPGTTASGGGVDFEDVTGNITVTIQPGATSGTTTFQLTTIADNAVEGDETIRVSGASGSFTVNPAEITLTDGNTAPTTITLTVDTDAQTAGNQSEVAEGETTEVTVTAAFPDGSATLPADTAVAVTVGGGGSNPASSGGVDFENVTIFAVTIPKDQTSGTATFNLKTTEDELFEGPETVQVSGAAPGFPGNFTVTPAEITITDDDAAPVISIAAQSVGEGAGSATLTVTRTGDLSGTSSASYAFSDGTATGSGTDYTGTSGTVTFAANAASATIPVTIVQDTLWEDPDETFTVTLSNPNWATLGTASATITITGDDAAPSRITLSVDPTSVTEGGGAQSVEVTATLDGGTTRTEDTEVSVSVNDGEATADHEAVTGITVTILAGEAKGKGSFTITPVDDTLDDDGERVEVTGTTTVGLDVTGTEVTILDDDGAPTAITLSVDPASVSEGSGTTQVTVTAAFVGSSTLTTATEVRVTVGSATATAGTDFEAVSDFEVTIPEGATSGAANFDLVVTDDNMDEAAETVTVGGTASGFTVRSATLTLTDDDDAPSGITLSLDPTSVTEDGGAQSVEVTATLDGGTTRTEDTEVSVSVNDGEATGGGVDFEDVTGFTLTIPAGDRSANQTFDLTVTDDNIDDDAENVRVTGTTTVGLTVTGTDLTIEDNDSASTEITLTVTPIEAAEGETTSITVTAAFPEGSPALATATEVRVTVEDGTAMAPADYAAVTGFTLTIPAGATSADAAQPFDLTVADDDLVDPGETVQVSGTATNFDVTPAEITLTDGDSAPTSIVLTVDKTTAAEGATTAVTVTAAFPIGSPSLTEATEVTVTVGGPGTTATGGGVDFEDVTGFTLTIPAGATSADAAQPFDLTVADDDLVDPGEIVRVSGTAEGFTVSPVDVEITDGDTKPTEITLSVDPANVGEGSGTTQVTVTAAFSEGSATLTTATNVTVSAGGSGSTATVDKDFDAVSDFTVTIAAGATSGSETFDLTVTNDKVVEGSETVSVSGTAAGFSVTGTRITITDNDSAPTGIRLSVDPPSVGEGSGTTQVTVTAAFSEGSATLTTATNVTVSVGGVRSTATVDKDFDAVSDFTVTIAAGATSGSETFDLTVTNDKVVEGSETVSVSGTAAGFSVTGTRITITDNDTAPTGIMLSVDPASAPKERRRRSR